MSRGETRTTRAARRATLRRRLLRLKSAYLTYTLLSRAPLRRVSRWLDVLMLLGAFATLGALAVLAGFDNSEHDALTLRRILRAAQWTFIVNILYNLTLNFRDTLRSSTALKWAVDAALLITLLPLLYPRPEHPWLPWLERFLYGHEYLYAVMLVYSVIEVSRWVTKLMDRRTNPAMLLSGSFAVCIVIGTLLLKLPNCTYIPISFVDSFFVATSAVCITGLTTVDVSTVFTPLGQTVLALLIQTGALGVLTFTSFFALFYTQGNSIYSQLMVKDLVYTRSFSELLPTILYILAFTLVIEALGAVLIFQAIHGVFPMTLEEEVGCAAFHSLSAFANAGFSTIHGGLSNPLLLYGNQWLYLAMSLIITAGSIGFPILINAKDALALHARRLLRLRCGERPIAHVWSMNSKLVLVTSTLLLVAGAVIFYILEYDNSLAGMDTPSRLAQSIFNSVVPRSAGFSSVSPATFLPVTLLVVMALMWIGGAAQSTAGGIKVNTFAAMALGVRSLVTGRNAVTAYGRTIAPASMMRVLVVVAVSILSLLGYTFLLLLLEPDLPARDLLFEAVSAVFTVGSSLGVTPQLCGASKVVLCTAMFFGRIGLLSLLMGLLGRRHPEPRYPSDSIIIN